MTETLLADPAPIEAPKPRKPARKRAVGAPKAGPATRERLLTAATAEFVRHGFAGARVERILSKAKANPRMLYHHFGSKDAIYVAVLEAALGRLRAAELRLDVEGSDPLDGLLQLFDFMNGHFESNPTLVRLFTNENLLEARFMRTSAPVRDMSSPVLSMIGRLLDRGMASGRLAATLDPLRVYVLMVALSQFHLSNVHTLSVIFDRDLSDAAWRRARAQDARQMLEGFLGA